MASIQKSKVRVRKTDKYRAMLTETLPYEVPMLFSNEGLYLRAKSGELDKFNEKNGLNIFTLRATIPYKYKIKKNAYESRGLSIMHPALQVRTSDFYSKYDHLLVGLCQRSPFSLRAPGNIASYFVERSRAQRSPDSSKNCVEEVSSGFDYVPKTASSYFAYKKYAFMHRFYDSTEFITLEKKFKFLCKLDISDCFNRIYTHTICWAVKSKSHAKRNRQQDTFENEFDKILQDANHGETAGIIIGPEVSRIFAEIILQRVDLDILNKATQNDLINDFDYTIKRYVDDYFVYTNSIQVQDEINAIISECLNEYRLAINAGKTESHLRPFVTNPSISRQRISIDIKEFFEKHIKKETENVDPSTTDGPSYRVLRIKNSSRLANQTIASIKRSIGVGGSYDTSANYFFGTVKKLLNQLTRKKFILESAETSENLYYFLSALMDIAFFYYSMTPRVRQTYLISEIILIAMKLMKDAPKELRDALTRKIVHESQLVITSSNTKPANYKIEVMNLMLVLKSLGSDYLLDQATLTKIFNASWTDSGVIFDEKLDYFQFVFLASYLGGIPAYDFLLKPAISHCIKRFNDSDWSQNAELVFLFFDLLTCPHVPEPSKILLAKTVLKHLSNQDLNARAKTLLETTGSSPWFFDWHAPADMALVLQKKELRTPY